MTKPRILVVDDERIVSLDVQGALARLGYQVVGAASSGEQAVALAANTRPDLVLMDIRLVGEMDGTEAALRITQANDIPVVFLTAYSDEQTMRRALAASPFGYLIKPFEDRELRGAIELGLAKHGAERDLKRARRAAQEADRAKTAFLATLSHELRTPMNGIQGMAELLLLSGLDQEQAETVKHLRTCAQAFTAVLNQLLEFSSLEAGVCDVSPTVFAPVALLEDTVAQYAPRAAAQGLELRLRHGPLPARLNGPATQIRKGLGILLDNALAYTEKGGVEIEAVADPDQSIDGGVFPLLVRVRDTGPGIDPAYLPKVFESFTQAEDYMTRRQGGLGLGLAICRRLATCLGGHVGVDSQLGHGSEFRLHLPLGFPPEVASDAESRLPGVRLLLVESEGETAPALAQALAAAGAELRIGSGPEETAAQLAAECVDVIVLGPTLSAQEGLTLVRMLRTGLIRSAPDTPVVALRPGADPAEASSLCASGLDVVLTEPGDAMRLVDTLAKLLHRPEGQDGNNSHRQGADPS